LCRLSTLIETFSRKKIPDHQQNVIIEITAEDSTEEDIEIPYVMLKLGDRSS
jgi:ubiquitin-activating enzyme E1